MPRIDTHAHVFHRALPAVSGARYRPDYDAPLDAYLAFLDANGIGCGVLVQPSFLGTDNGFLVDCLKRAGGRLAGVVVVDPDVSDEVLGAIDADGVVGVRLNLIGRGVECLDAPGAGVFLGTVERHGWHVEVHVEGPRLPGVLAALDGFRGPIVVDHFGRPDPAHGRACAGFRRLLDGAGDPRLHVKLSAPYRTPGLDVRAAAADLVEALGPERLLWGSDRPWTQHEDAVAVDALLPEAFGLDAEVVRSLDETAARLFRMPRAQE